MSVALVILQRDDPKQQSTVYAVQTAAQRPAHGAALQERGLDTAGKKPDLVQRLLVSV